MKKQADTADIGEYQIYLDSDDYPVLLDAGNGSEFMSALHQWGATK